MAETELENKVKQSFDTQILRLINTGIIKISSNEQIELLKAFRENINNASFEAGVVIPVLLVVPEDRLESQHRSSDIASIHFSHNGKKVAVGDFYLLFDIKVGMENTETLNDLEKRAISLYFEACCFK